MNILMLIKMKPFKLFIVLLDYQKLKNLLKILEYIGLFLKIIIVYGAEECLKNCVLIQNLIKKKWYDIF